MKLQNTSDFEAIKEGKFQINNEKSNFQKDDFSDPLVSQSLMQMNNKDLVFNNGGVKGTKQRTHNSIDKHISIKRTCWNKYKNNVNKLEKINNLATKKIIGVDPIKFRNTSFPIKSSYRYKPETNDDYDDDSF